MSSSQIISVIGLKKNYGDVKAVRGIDFHVNKGELFAFLGPNGAGKTTTIDILCTLLRPDSGEVKVNGYILGRQDDEIRKDIGVVFQDSLLDNLLTVRENLFIRGSFYRMPGKTLSESVDRAVSAAGVKGFLNRPYGKLSGGQRRRADMARALINTPEILFLDEPTTGLDPQTRRSIWDTIRNLQKETGMTVFLTTHYKEEAAKADYVAIIDNGKISASGTPSELRAKYSTDTLRLIPKDSKDLKNFLLKQNIEFVNSGGAFIINIPGTLDALPLLKKMENMITGFEVISGSMDDAFVNITGFDIREGGA
ncbi:MAG: ATP-binding cassette domain-containing protein [Candidatus Humimicrobiaceae bacterium]|jgi:multidrug/hemolysin transport system ATP-binding protein|nr:ATP-binding cassette domain-containing protein [Candidatus Humimicrobiaceae bacterium]